MSAILEQARARAAAITAKAEKEVAIAAMLPDLGRAPLIVQQRDCVWLCYPAATWADILATFDAFSLAPAFVTKKSGWAASVAREFADDDKTENLVSDAFAWVSFSHYQGNSQDANFCAFATLPDGTPAQIRVRLEGAYYSKTPWHKDLATRFVCDNSSRREENRTYTATGPAFLAQAAFTWGSGTGRNDGGGLIRSGVFMTRDCLRAAIATLAE